MPNSWKEAKDGMAQWREGGMPGNLDGGMILKRVDPKHSSWLPAFRGFPGREDLFYPANLPDVGSMSSSFWKTPKMLPLRNN